MLTVKKSVCYWKQKHIITVMILRNWCNLPDNMF